MSASRLDNYYEVFGARSRPDAYPGEIYRVAKQSQDPNKRVVEQYGHGRFFPVADEGNWLLYPWIAEQLEKGLLWRLQEGLSPWDHYSPQPPYLLRLDVRFWVPEKSLEAIANGRIVPALREVEGWPAQSRSVFQQRSIWHIVQKGILETSGAEEISHRARVGTGYFANAHAAKKKYHEDSPRGFGNVSIAGDAQRLEIKARKADLDGDGDFMSRLSKAAQDRLAGIDAENQAEEERAKADHEEAVKQLHARLKELTVKPSVELTADEFREKMQLKREIACL